MPGNKDEDFSRLTIPETVEIAGDARPLENVGLGLLLEKRLSGLAALFIEADKRENSNNSWIAWGLKNLILGFKIHLLIPDTIP